ncbi:MAG TPA: hypothetical protein VNZ22_19765, partial [Bacillota bacterium]|nr:hypothetical protein [Bacillota bacterium]
DRVQLADAGAYTLQVVDSMGRTNSQTTSLTVQSTPQIGSRFTIQQVPLHGSVCLSAAVFGSEPLVFQWQCHGTNLLDDGRFSGTTTSTLCLRDAQFEDNGLYCLVAANSFGSVTSAIGQVQVAQILAWGDNSSGQLEVPLAATNILAISSRGDHNLALRADYTLLAWGDNTYGQNQVPSQATNVVAIAEGTTHSLALRADGSVVAWGNNQSGQTNVPSQATNVVAIAAGRLHSLALRADGTVVSWGDNWLGSVPASATNNVVAIAAGDVFNLALRADGTLYQWGAQQSPPATATNVVAIAAGFLEALAVRADGTLVRWGWNVSASTNLPSEVTNLVSVAAGPEHSLGLQADGRVIAWGDNFSGECDVPPLGTNAIGISAGTDHSLMLVGGTPLEPVVPQPRSVNLGEGVWLCAGMTAGTLATYQWQFNGVDLPGATNAALLLPWVHWTNAGIYRVVIRTPRGTVSGPPTALTVLRTPLRFDPAASGLQPTTQTYRLRLLGASGLGSIVIYSSTNLVDWTPAFEASPTIGPVEFNDPLSAAGSRKFYRALEK